MTTITRYPPTATTPQARNRSTNPSMLTGSLADWSVSTGAGSMAYSSAVGSSLRFITSAAGQAVVEHIVPASAGEVFSVSIDIQPFTTSRTGLLRVYFLNSSSTVIAGPFDTTAAVAVGSWTTLTVDNITAPANTAYIRILPGITNSAGAGQAINVTRALIKNGTVAGPYFDGDWPSAYPLFYYWEGQRGLSASRRVDVLGGPDQIHPDLGIGTPFRMSREGRSYARPLLESSSARAVLVPAGPRSGEFQFLGADTTVATWLDFLAPASLFYIVDEVHATMWFAITSDIAFEQVTPTRAYLTVPFVETPAP